MTDKVLLVMSGAYCPPEVMAEFGRIPPCFLPLGGMRLFEHQAMLAQRIGATVALTLPDDFELPEMDFAKLKELGFRIILNSASLSLSAAVLSAIDQIDDVSALYLLHGDTLVNVKEPALVDRVVTAQSAEFYEWADVSCAPENPERIVGIRSGMGDGLNERLVACGFFSFSRVDVLRTALAEAGDFVQALQNYAQTQGLRAVPARQWSDFGHLPLIYASRRDMLVSRAFNAIYCDGRSVLKESPQAKKIQAEAFWFENLPPELRLHVPQYLGRGFASGKANYRLEYLFLPTLAELSVFGRLPKYTWRRILTHILEFVSLCRAHLPPADHPLNEAPACDALFHHLIKQKSRNRIVEFLEARGWEEDATVTLNGERTPPLVSIVEKMVAMIRRTAPGDISLVHGDLFFGNMLYDFRGGRVLVIDPRGSFGDNKPTLYSDKRYDIAKLAHSILGGYDRLLTARGGFSQTDDRTYTLDHERMLGKGIIEDFMERQIDGKKLFTRDIAAMTALLFFSMLPLHSEAPMRQNAFLAMGLLLSRIAHNMPRTELQP